MKPRAKEFLFRKIGETFDFDVNIKYHYSIICKFKNDTLESNPRLIYNTLFFDYHYSEIETKDIVMEYIETHFRLDSYILNKIKNSMIA